MVIGAPYQQYDPINLRKTYGRGVVYIYYGQGAGELDFDNPYQVVWTECDQYEFWFIL